MKTAVVTGANSGIGYETALALAKQHFRVVMLCRSLERGEQARQKVINESRNEDVFLITADLASLESLTKAAEEISRKFPIIDVLINNAGVFALKKEYTEDGFEKMTGVNYIGHFYLTQKLIPNLEKAEAARIVVVSSNGYKMVRFQLSDLQPENRFTFWGNYGRSKLMNLLFAQESAVRLRDKGITVNALHPGAVATNMGVDRKTGFGKRVYTFLRPFFKTPAEGAETSVYLATSDEVSGITGQFFIDCRQTAIKRIGKDRETARLLYEETERLIDERIKE